MLGKKELLQGKILILDDSPDILRLLRGMLHGAGFKDVRCVQDPREIIGTFMHYKPDLVVLDLVMPHVDGFAVMEEIKKLDDGQYLPVLVLSAISDQDVRIRALEAGARDFLNKPFDRLEAVQRIRNLLEARLLQKRVHNQNEILEDMVDERTRELEQTRTQIIRRLGKAAEFKDEETGLHIIRISKMCELLGKAAGLNNRECRLLGQASPMHDIGKIGIPDHILQKPGPLNDEEWKIMKTHTTIGEELLSGDESELLSLARRIAATHHERWNGTGYPRRLRDLDIPLSGRICAICDVFDALTSKRPYKEAWSVNKAVEEIRRCRGSHFDPDLVDLFLEILPQIKRVIAAYQDEKAN